MESSEGLAKHNERQILKNPNSAPPLQSPGQENQPINPVQIEPKKRSFLDKLLGRNKPQPSTTPETIQQSATQSENVIPSPAPTVSETEKSSTTGSTQPNPEPTPITANNLTETVNQNSTSPLPNYGETEGPTPGPTNPFEAPSPSNISQFPEQNPNNTLTMPSEEKPAA